MNHLCRTTSSSSSSQVFRLITEMILLVLILLAAPAIGQQYENEKLFPAEGTGGDHFGRAVALFGDRALIGAQGDDDRGDRAGAAYLYGYDSTSGAWREEAKLLASDGNDDDFLGISVSLSGDRALVGADHDADNGYEAGAAYVFHYDTVTGTWQEEAKLLASDGDVQDYFGCAVAISGDRALVGAFADEVNGPFSGAVYFFEFDTLSGTWQEKAKLSASDGTDYDLFGLSIALSGERALIGASFDEAWTGAAYMFDHDSVSGSWYEACKLTASDAEERVQFGQSVALSGDRALVGCGLDNDNGHYSGSAYVFGFDSVSGTWQEEAKLFASDGKEEDQFGAPVSLPGDKAVLGAPGDDVNGLFAGSAYFLNFASTLSLDIKCNGQDQNVVVDSSQNVTLTIDIANGYHPGASGDFWVAVLPASTGSLWTYGSLETPYWQNGSCNEYYTGIGFAHSATVLDQPLPVGGYRAFLAVDLSPDGNLNMPSLWEFDEVDITVQ